jgi:alkylation response protein AidB-like acyl-CoA dehydrogenase
MWRFADRPELEALMRSARAVARGPVARLVAEGGRHSNTWDEKKGALLTAFDAAGITAVSLDRAHEGFSDGPKNLALGLAAFELAWVDGGAATTCLAGHLALAPLEEKGTPEQVATYIARCAPPRAGEKRVPWRGAFCLTEPLPYVGVDTGVLSGKVTVARWDKGKEPVLRVEKRGRFITNMDFANFVVAAVESADPRLSGSCMVLLEESDPGTFDRGEATRKLVHQLSSNRDPVFSLEVPASRIVGGYTVEEGKIVPRYDHREVIESVFRRTRVTVGLLTASKLLSAVEPVIRYQRERFRGGERGAPGSPRQDMGLQTKEDVLHRLIDVWATGEASASVGFAAARFFDDFDEMEQRREEIFAEAGLKAGRARMRDLAPHRKLAVEFVRLAGRAPGERMEDRFNELGGNRLVRFLVEDALAEVICPAVKLWSTGQGTNMMREAVGLIGGYGITEDCPGFLGQKWMDAQFEATYEGPEAVQRRLLAAAMINPVFLAILDNWMDEMRAIGARRPGTGACTLATAMELWRWSLRYLLRARDADGKLLYRGERQGVTFPMADALAWLIASRFQILDLLELEAKGADAAELAGEYPGLVAFTTDLCHVQAARAAGETSRLCTELVFGYNRHPAWDCEGAACYRAEEVEALDGVMSGFAAYAPEMSDVIAPDGSHAVKAGPCVKFRGMEAFTRLRGKLDGCLTGARLAKDRAARALTTVEIPEELDYPA